MPPATPTANTTANPGPAARPSGLRSFARFGLLRLLGRSERTMAWLVSDPRSNSEQMLVLPRTQSADSAAAQRWAQGIRKASRLQHPQIAPVVEIGLHEGWPFALYDPSNLSTLTDRLGSEGLAPADAVPLMSQALEGLAYAHEAGVAHHDLQPYLMLVSDQGALCLVGLEVALDEPGVGTLGRGLSGVESGALRVQRLAAERDVLALGLILYQSVAGPPALEENDIGRAISRMPPEGQEIVRLPWATLRPIPDVLRAIINRATDRQERQRYRSARTLARALEGWLQSEENSGTGPLALLLDRLGTVGLLPSAPGSAERAARLALMDRKRTNELAAVVIDDLALAFELLRAVNAAQVRGAQVAGNGPVLTVRRAIAMLGLEGVRRCALALRAWPGPLQEAPALELGRLIDRCKRAGRVAVALRPAGYDAEVVYLLTLLQNLGRLVVQYHFADESMQIRRLMQPAPAERPGEAEQPGMAEDAAALTVLGVDIESVGLAIAKRWGFDEAVLHIIRRLPLSATVHSAQCDDDLLRAAASCANEVVDVQALPAAQQAGALHKVVVRYAKLLHLTTRDIQAAVHGAASMSTSEALLAGTTPATPAAGHAPDAAKAVS